jgi:hypothetical protein
VSVTEGSGMTYLLKLIFLFLTLFLLAACQVEAEPGPIPIESQSVQATSINTPIPTITSTLAATPTITEIILTADFLEFVAFSSVEEQVEYEKSGYQSPDGSIIAYTNKPIQVWIYSQGSLEEVNKNLFQQAIGNNRTNWPPFTYVFSFESIEPERVIVLLNIHYDGGITGQTRG